MMSEGGFMTCEYEMLKESEDEDGGICDDMMVVDERGESCENE